MRKSFTLYVNCRVIKDFQYSVAVTADVHLPHLALDQATVVFRGARVRVLYDGVRPCVLQFVCLYMIFKRVAPLSYELCAFSSRLCLLARVPARLSSSDFIPLCSWNMCLCP